MKRIGCLGVVVSAILTAQSAIAQSSPILGRWQGNFDNKYPMGFLFTPEGKFVTVFGIDGNNSTLLAGTTANYKLDASQKPMHIDVSIQDAKEPVLTIVDLPDPQTLRIQMKDTNPGKPRPTGFGDYTQMKKVSDRAIESLDSAKLEQAAKTPEGEGQMVMQTLAQSALFVTVESGKLPSNLEQLGLSTTNTQNYRYQLQTQPKQITLIARPKKANLKSYISVVTTGTERNINFTSTAVCRSVRPSLLAPPAPRISSPFVSIGNKPVNCGLGSEPVKF